MFLQITVLWKKVIITILINAVLINAAIRKVENRASMSSEPKKVVCYHANWSAGRSGNAKSTPSEIKPNLCTHLIYAFGIVDDPANGLKPSNENEDIKNGGYRKFTGLKMQNKNLKTMISVGGWLQGTSKSFQVATDSDRRRAFVKNVIGFLRQHNFDGMDLDWQYPTFREGGKLADRENHASLIQELREEFNKESTKTGKIRLILSMTAPGGIPYIDQGYDIQRVNKFVDFMNIVSYDYHTAFELKVNHHAPLYDGTISIDSTIKHYFKLGANREKLVIGIPTYGRTYTLFSPENTELGSPADGPGQKGEYTGEDGYLAYFEICGLIKNNSNDWTVEHPNSTAMGPYAYNGNQWVCYDDEDIVKRKARYVNENGLGGIMFWTVNNDDFRGDCDNRPFPLIEAGKEALFENSRNTNAKDQNRRPNVPKRTKPPLADNVLRDRNDGENMRKIEPVTDSETASTSSETKKVVCYHANWSGGRPGNAKSTPSDIRPNLCTHLIYAFCQVDDPNNGLKPSNEDEDIKNNGYAKFTGLKMYNKNLRTMISVGGWLQGTSKSFQVATDKNRRAAFVKNVVAFLRQHNFDGIDVDWQYPASRGGKSSDRENHATLLQELREEFNRESSRSGKRRLLLSMTAPGGIPYIEPGYDILKVTKYVDFMNIVSYDYHTAFEPTVNHHAPLYSGNISIDSTIKHYFKLGADHDKLVIGIPTYGRTYTLFSADSTELGSTADGPGQKGEATGEDGYLAYFEICAQIKNNSEDWTVVHPNSTAMGPYAYNGNQWVCYDDEDIVRRKARYVNENGLGGIMFWTVNNDDFRGECHNRAFPLIEAGKEALFENNPATMSDVVPAVRIFVLVTGIVDLTNTNIERPTDDNIPKDTGDDVPASKTTIDNVPASKSTVDNDPDATSDVYYTPEDSNTDTRSKPSAPRSKTRENERFSGVDTKTIAQLLAVINNLGSFKDVAKQLESLSDDSNRSQNFDQNNRLSRKLGGNSETIDDSKDYIVSWSQSKNELRIRTASN